MSTIRVSPTSFPHIVNATNYKDYHSLYSSQSGSLQQGGRGGNFRLRNGLAVTVTIPPTLQAFRYPKLIQRNFGTPVISSAEAQKLQERNRWYRAARANANKVDKKILDLRRHRNRVILRRNQARAAGDTALVTELSARIDTINARLATLSRDSSARVLGTYSTEFEISDFITSLSWSSAYNNGFVEMSIGLDNSQGMFNYLPEGAKVTLWRRKSPRNDHNSTDLFGGGKWYRYVVTYVRTKSRSASGRDHKMDITCGDRLSFASAQNYTDKKRWVKGDSHPRGWTPREITIMICKAAGIPYKDADIPSSYDIRKTVTVANGVRTVTSTRVVLPRIEYNPGKTDLGSLLSGAWNRSLAKVERLERLPYTIHMRQGTLVIDFISPPGDAEGQEQLVMLNDRDNIESITLEESIESDEVYTELKASGTVSYYETDARTGKRIRKKKKVNGTFTPSGVRGEMVIKAYGRRREQYTFKQPFNSTQGFKKAAQQRIDEKSRPIRDLKVEARAPLGLWPYYYVNLGSRYVGIRGNVWIEGVTYTVENGLIKVSLDLNANWKQFTKGEEHYAKYPTLFNRERWY